MSAHLKVSFSSQASPLGISDRIRHSHLKEPGRKLYAFETNKLDVVTGTQMTRTLQVMSQVSSSFRHSGATLKANPLPHWHSWIDPALVERIFRCPGLLFNAIRDIPWNQSIARSVGFSHGSTRIREPRHLRAGLSKTRTKHFRELLQVQMAMGQNPNRTPSEHPNPH